MPLNFGNIIVKADNNAVQVRQEVEAVKVKSPAAPVFAVSPSWDGIADKPSAFPPAPHNHDERYYTEQETDALLEPKLEADDLVWGAIQGDIDDQPDLLNRIQTAAVASGATVSVDDAAVSPLISAKVAFSGDTNINEMQFMSCGKNLVDMSKFVPSGTTATVTYDPHVNGIHIVSTAEAAKATDAHFGATSNLVIPAGQLTMSFRINSGAVVGSNTFVCLRNSSASISSSSKVSLTTSNTEYRLTWNNNTNRYLSIMCDYSDDHVPVDFWIYDLQIEIGEEKTDYEPYRGVFQTVSWENCPGYCKSGEIDVVSGKFTLLDDPQNPQTFQIDPLPLMSYDNKLYVFSNVGNVSVTYFKSTAEGQQMGSASAGCAASDKTKADVVVRSFLIDCLEANPLVITDAAEGAPDVLQILAFPKQLGSGDPSPSNVRDFVPYTSIDLYYSGSKQTDYKKLSLDIPQEIGDVYLGYWEPKTGYFANRYDLVRLDPSWTDWTIVSSNNPNGTVFTASEHTELFTNYNSTANAYKCSNALIPSSNRLLASADANSFYWGTNTSNNPIRIIYGEPYGGTTVEEFKAWLRETPVYLCGAKAYQHTYNLPRQDINLVKGENRFWTDNGRVKIAYKTDTSLTVSEILTDITDANNRLDNVENIVGIKRYGVSGVGGSASKLTRLYDAVGMTAQVGTDGTNTDVVNDFDDAEPFKLRKCVGQWTLEDGHAVFHVEAYQGDTGYAEDGTMGDYVAVECPLSYYYRNGNELAISAHRYPGYRPFDIFCKEHNPEDTMPYVYIPAYELALDANGHAVSLPGLYPVTGSYGKLMNAARTYQNGALGNKAYIYPAALNFYLYALMTVEFADQNIQSVMYGAAGLGTSTVSATCKDLTHYVTSDKLCSAGLGVCIGTGTISGVSNAYDATHRVISVTPCDANGVADPSGTYRLLEVELIKQYEQFNYVVGNTYNMYKKGFLTGVTASVSTPSGSPVENKDGRHPCKYRWIENPFGGMLKTSADLFLQDVTVDGANVGEIYFLNDPEQYTETDVSKPDSFDSNIYTKLDITDTVLANGYLKEKNHSLIYPDIWISKVHGGTGTSGTTYYCDYYQSSTNSSHKASARFGGCAVVSNAAYCGANYIHFGSLPSGDYRNCGSVLWIKQG